MRYCAKTTNHKKTDKINKKQTNENTHKKNKRKEITETCKRDEQAPNKTQNCLKLLIL